MLRTPESGVRSSDPGVRSPLQAGSTDNHPDANTLHLTQPQHKPPPLRHSQHGETSEEGHPRGKRAGQLVVAHLPEREGAGGGGGQGWGEGKGGGGKGRGARAEALSECNTTAVAVADLLSCLPPHNLVQAKIPPDHSLSPIFEAPQNPATSALASQCLTHDNGASTRDTRPWCKHKGHTAMVQARSQSQVGLAGSSHVPVCG